MGEFVNNGKSNYKPSIFDLSVNALEVLIGKGIIDYVDNRSEKCIDQVVLYGENSSLMREELILRYDFYCRIGSVSEKYGIYDGIWHLDIDDLIYLYYRGL